MNGMYCDYDSIIKCKCQPFKQRKDISPPRLERRGFRNVIFPMKQINFVLLIFLIAAVVAGCALLVKQDARLELATQYATLKVIAETDVTAEQVQERVEAIRQIVEADAQVTVHHLAQQVVQSISWDHLDAADQLLLNAVLMEAELRLAEIVGDGLLDDQGKVAVGVLLDWIEDAAVMEGS